MIILMLKGSHDSIFTTCHIMFEQNISCMIGELATSSKIIIIVSRFLY